ncbi:MAG TPA: AAA family ATPase [Symbiobacteriaceae bacterium]|nr:AAA family ATPase [Symbiobacteriaceae bacterium]
MKKLPFAHLWKELLAGVLIGGLLYTGLKDLSYIGPYLLAVAFLAFLLQRQATVRAGGGGAGGIGGGGLTSVPDVKFADIGGQNAAKKELLEAIEFIRNREQIKQMGIRPLKGVLLTGPPGTGKTLLAKAAANYTDSIFLSASGSEFVEMYAGVGAQRVRSLFVKSREAARKAGKESAVIFIDEIEVLGAKRGGGSGGHMEYEQTLNELLVQLDGVKIDDSVQVLVMGATNRVDMLDPALMRPGRFDRIVQVDLPDKEARLSILQIQTGKKPLAPNVDLVDLARQSFGFSGAHLEALTNEAAILALREGLKEIEMRHFVEAVDKVMLGEKLDRKPAADEKHRIAVHEAGHAVVGEWVDPGSVATITVTPRGRAMGYVRSNPQDDQYLHTKTQLEADIRRLLAGFLAEEMILGEGSTGASNDFERANKLAWHIVGGGMSRLGIIDPEKSDQKALAEEQSRIVQEQRALVAAHLESKRSALEALAAQLVADEVIDGEAVRALLVV